MGGRFLRTLYGDFADCDKGRVSAAGRNTAQSGVAVLVFTTRWASSTTMLGGCGRETVHCTLVNVRPKQLQMDGGNFKPEDAVPDGGTAKNIVTESIRASE